MIHAILFLPPDAHHWLAAGAQYATRRGYDIIAVVSVWADAQSLAAARRAVVVAPRRAHVPADYLPRLEIIEEENLLPKPAEPPASQRRPQRRT